MRRRALFAQARAETLLQLRRGENLIVTLAIPLGILLFFAKVDAISTDFAHPVDFLVPGVLSLAVMAAAMVSLGIATGFERRYGVLKRLGSTPLSRGGLLVAKTATVLALEILQIVLVVVVGVAIGWHVPSGIFAAVGLLLLGTVAFAGIGMLMAGTLRAEANLAAANGLFLVLLFLGGMAYPLAKLPIAMQDFAKVLPAAALSETVRSVLAAQAFPAGEFAVLMAWAVGAPLLAAALLPLGGVKQRIERPLEIARARRPEDPFAYHPGLVDEHGVGHRVHVVAVRHGVVRRVLEQGRERHAQAPYEGPGVVREILVVHADDRDARRVVVLDPLQRGHVLLAGMTPRGEEGQHDDLPAQARQCHRLSVDAREREVGREAPHLRSRRRDDRHRRGR